MYSNFSLLFASLQTLKSKNRVSQKGCTAPASVLAITFNRKAREALCFSTCTTVEGVPFLGSLISRCT